MKTEGKIETILKRQLIINAGFIRNALETLCPPWKQKVKEPKKVTETKKVWRADPKKDLCL